MGEGASSSGTSKEGESPVGRRLEVRYFLAILRYAFAGHALVPGQAVIPSRGRFVRAGKVAGTLVTSDELPFWLKRGMRYFYVHSDPFLRIGLQHPISRTFRSCDQGQFGT
jgi:hypothetical protein